MSSSEDLATVAMWMMIVGGAGGLIGLWAILRSDGLGRGDLSKPLLIVGVCLFFLGVFLDQRWVNVW